MGSPKSRLRTLEGRSASAPPPGRAQQEIQAIDAELRRIEDEMRACGEDPHAEPDPETRAFFESLEGLTLDEKIEALERELARCPDAWTDE